MTAGYSGKKDRKNGLITGDKLAQRIGITSYGGLKMRRQNN